MVTNSFENRNRMQQMGKCNMHSKAPNFFWGGSGWGVMGWGSDFSFFWVHDVFPSCS
jgi:hypothetical protein